jgi:mannose-6-phosphate isomerase-like protein (cupin superfamily)
VAHWRELPDDWVEAPDGSQVRPLWAVPARGSLAHFRLPPEQASRPKRHVTVHELWFVVAGSGEMVVGDEAAFALRPGISVDLPPGTRFQFRSGAAGLDIVGVTMPPWPDDRDEALDAPAHWPV